MLSTRQGEEVTAESVQGTTQKGASLQIDLHNKSLLIETITREDVVREKARLFIMAVKYRLGCPVYTTAGKSPVCPKCSDVYGDHAISCGTEGERIACHNHLRDTLYHTCASAALAPTKEGRALLPGTNARPGVPSPLVQWEGHCMGCDCCELSAAGAGGRCCYYCWACHVLCL